MTVIEDAQDNVGRGPLIFKGYKNLEEVHSWSVKIKNCKRQSLQKTDILQEHKE